MQPYPRSTIGTPTPPATRPRLDRVRVMLAHEVGVLNTARYRSTDPARVLDDARAAAAYGISAGKTWEYQYMIGLDGSVFTQAGEYRASHCLNFNSESAGVIFLNALDVATNAAQIVAWHELRTFMVDDGILHPDHVVAPHYRYRSTSCPGLRAEAPSKAWASPTGQGRLGNLIPALVTPPPPPPPPHEIVPPHSTGDVEMIALDYTHPTTKQWTCLTWTGSHLSHVTNGHADGVVRRMGVARAVVSDAEVDGIISSSTCTTPCPPEWVNTARGALWSSRRP
jgi:hypothetical protein